MSLYEKIYNIMVESEGLEKDLTVGSGTNSYRAVGEKEVLNMLKPLFKKYKLIVFPVDGDISEQNSTFESEYNGKISTKTRNVTQVKVNFKIVDTETGEFETLVGFGNGADSQDKGSGKAFTYAYKTMLSKTFMLFSGEDTDNTHSDDISKGAPTTKKEPLKTETKPSARSQALYNIATSKGITIASVVSSVRKNFNKSMDEMTADEYEKVRSTYDSMLAKS
jgi:hypothetical protein